MDINEEERAKGKTVEVGRIDFETNTKRFTLLDCPGHHNFVPNMIGGAAQADVACLVISARAGEFEAGFEKNGQTREHAMLAKSLGCKYIIILVNKLDSVDWDEKRYYSILEQVTPFLINNCGFEKENIFNVGISGLKGQNMKDFVSSEICNWYKDKTLFNMLDTLPNIDRSKNEFVRLPVLDLFKDMGNTYIFGKVESGIIKNKMNLSVLPIKKELKVVNIFDNKDNKVAYATPGENIKLQITGVEEDMIKRGSVLCGLKYHCYVVHEFIAEFSSLDLGENMIITKGFTAMMHMHTILELATITKIIHILDYEGNIVKRKNNTLKSLTKGLIKIKVEKPIAIEKYSEFPELGRFTLRQGSKTIGIGTVHKVKPLDNDYIYNSYFLNKEPEIDINDIGAIDLNNDRLDNIAEMEEGEDI